MEKSSEPVSDVGVYHEGMPWNPVEKVIMERRSIRGFRKEPLPDNMIRRILEAGRFAPTAGNSQPWKFIVVNSPEIISEMERDVVKFIKRVMFFLDYTRGGKWRRRITKPLAKFYVRLMPNELHPVPTGLMSQIAQDKAPVFHGAPTLILILEDKRGVGVPATDIGICGQNMVLAAHSMGLGTCWVGFGKMAFEYTDKWKKRLNIEYPYTWANSLSIGWPKGEPDGMIERPAHPVDWYEDGKKTIFE
jgi:nitroreductase